MCYGKMCYNCPSEVKSTCSAYQGGETSDKILELEDGALEELLDFEMPELDNTGYMKEEKKMTLKERILAKIDYREIAERIYEKLEDDIADEVAQSFDADTIAEDMINGYKYDYLNIAKEVITESIEEDLDYTEIEDHFKEHVQEQVDNM